MSGFITQIVAIIGLTTTRYAPLQCDLASVDRDVSPGHVTSQDETAALRPN